MNDIKRLDYAFDIAKLVEEVQYIIDHVGLHKHHSQISLKHTGNTELGDAWYQGCGSLKFKFGEDFIGDDGKLKEQEVKLTQHDFTAMHPMLSSTYLGEVLETLALDYNYGRARIMGLKHKKVMSMHSDATTRLHIPLVTNENCLMIIDGNLYHMPADGAVYHTDTTKPHTALNANHNFMRLHLLFDLVE